MSLAEQTRKVLATLTPRSGFAASWRHERAAAIALVLAGCGGSPAAPPAKPVLTLGATTSSSAQVMWTSPGASGTSGTPAARELRYFNGFIGTAKVYPCRPEYWPAYRSVSLPPPQPGGTQENVIVTGLSNVAGVVTCFIMRVAGPGGESFSDSLAVALPP